MTLSATPFEPADLNTVPRRSGTARVAPAAGRRLRPARARHGTAMLAGVCASACAAVLLGLLAMQDPPAAVRPTPAPAPTAAPPVSGWSEVLHPFVAYDLAGGPFARLSLRYTARRNHADGAREDTLTYGEAVPGSAFLQVAFARRGTDPVPDTSPFVDAARLAGRASLAVTRSGLGSRLETRFGPFDLLGVTIERAGQSAPCLAFRLAPTEAPTVLAMVGLACGTTERPVTSATLACTLDKLDLVSAGDDEDLRAVFVAAERRRRDGCGDAGLGHRTSGFLQGAL